VIFYYQRLQSVDLKSYSAFAKRNLICLILSSILENHVVYGLGLAAMLHAYVCTTTGTALQWVNELRYPDVFVIRSRTFKCSLHNPKKSFYRSANYMFGKVGRIASEELILNLTRKCGQCQT